MTVVRKKIAGWIEMTYDAEIVLDGITWRRARGGFGTRGDREDWVADIPTFCISVSKWRDEPWRTASGGARFDTKEDAMRAQVRNWIRSGQYEVHAALRKAQDAREALAILVAADRSRT